MNEPSRTTAIQCPIQFKLGLLELTLVQVRRHRIQRKATSTQRAGNTEQCNVMNNLGGNGGPVVVLIGLFIATAMFVALIMLDSRLGMPVAWLAPTLCFVAAVATVFGFSALKLAEMLGGESVALLHQVELTINLNIASKACISGYARKI